jgi:hypothetical protein
LLDVISKKKKCLDLNIIIRERIYEDIEKPESDGFFEFFEKG